MPASPTSDSHSQQGPAAASGAKRPRREARAKPAATTGAPTPKDASEETAVLRRDKVVTAAAPALAPRDRVIALNVGGTIVRTLESTLRSSPSQLSEWLDNGFRGLPRDSGGRPFVDCDVRNFTYMLNYLRGYGLPAKADDLVMLAEDALRFRMESLQRDMGVKAPALWTFNPGPGVAPDGAHFSTVDTLSLCGTGALSTSLSHTVTFKIEKCDSIACGLIACDGAREDKQLFDQRRSVCYRSSGELVRYFDDEPLYCSGASYSNAALITVRVRYMPPGCTNASLPPLLRAVVVAPVEGATTSSTSVPGRVVGGVHQTLSGFTAASVELAHAERRMAQQQQPQQQPQPQQPQQHPHQQRPPYEQGQDGQALPRQGEQSVAQQGLPAEGTGQTATAGSSTTPPPLPSAAPRLRHSPAGGPDAALGGSMAQTGGGASDSSRAVPGAGGAATTAAAAVPICLSPLSLPETPIGAVILFSKDDEPQFEARWPVPVPPLQFAVSMQGNSAVTLLEAFSFDEHEERREGRRDATYSAAAGPRRLAHPQVLPEMLLPPPSASAPVMGSLPVARPPSSA